MSLIDISIFETNKTSKQSVNSPNYYYLKHEMCTRESPKIVRSFVASACIACRSTCKTHCLTDQQLKFQLMQKFLFSLCTWLVVARVCCFIKQIICVSIMYAIWSKNGQGGMMMMVKKRKSELSFQAITDINYIRNVRGIDWFVSLIINRHRVVLYKGEWRVNERVRDRNDDDDEILVV